uniref:Uncharacterized protein n=1 Tax=Arundo donax TaxID=35708 RepID=A0A0A9BIB1_ARUDO
MDCFIWLHVMCTQECALCSGVQWLCALLYWCYDVREHHQLFC